MAVVPNRRSRRMMRRLAIAGGVLAPTAAIAFTGGVASGAASSNDTVYKTLTSLESELPTVAASAGHTVTLPAKAWVEAELKSGNLTPAETNVLQEAPVTVTAEGPAPTATTIPVAANDPVMSTVCNSKDVLERTVATTSVYWGYTGSGWKNNYDIITLAIPVDHYQSTIYTRTSWSSSTSSPGPPTHHMTGDVETNYASLLGLVSFSVTQRFSFYGTDNWSSTCS